MPLRVVFMGSPDFAVPSLRALAARSGSMLKPYDVVGVVTQPDRPAGRGRTLKQSAVKQLALELGIATIQPVKLSQSDVLDQFRKWAPDIIVVAAFGQILKTELIELPRHGCINVHASLLPRWRGAAPVHAAILNGDAETGVTIMKMNVGLDTGPILSQCAIQLYSQDTTGFMTETLSKIGADLLIKTIPGYLSGTILPQAQPEEGVTHAPRLKKENGLLDFTLTAVELVRRVHAYNPWPGATMDFSHKLLKIHRAHQQDRPSMPHVPGYRVVHDGTPAVYSSKGLLVLDEVQLPGKKIMKGREFLIARRDWESG